MKNIIRREIENPDSYIDFAVIFVSYEGDELLGEYCFCVCNEAFASRDFYFYGEDFKEVYDFILEYVNNYNDKHNNIIKSIIVVEEEDAEGLDKLTMFDHEEERFIKYL